MSNLIIVKLRASISDSFPKTIQLMKGVDFSIRHAIPFGKPIRPPIRR